MESRSPLKNKPLRNPGQSLHDEINDKLDNGIYQYFVVPMLLWLLTGLEWFAKVRNVPRTPGIYAVIAVLLTVWGAVSFVRLRKRLNALKQGRDGEMAVGQFLERLQEEGTQVFHDVPGDGFNLDHVLIGPQGILVIETKTFSKPHPDAKVTFANGHLLVAGKAPDRDPIRQVRAEAKWLASTLKESTGKDFGVRGVVLFPGWFVEPVPTEIKREVWVLEPKALPGWLQQEGSVLSEPDVRLAAFHLSRYIRGC